MELIAKKDNMGKAISGTYEMTVTTKHVVQEGELQKALAKIAWQRKQLDEQEARLLEIKNEIDKLSAKGQ